MQEVASWAKKLAGLNDTAAQVLFNNELDGAAVLAMATQSQEKLYEVLVKAPNSLTSGAAVKLAKAISALDSNVQGEGSGRLCVC